MADLGTHGGSRLQVFAVALVVAAVATPSLLPPAAGSRDPPPELAAVLRAGGAETVARRAEVAPSARQRLALGLPIALNAASQPVLELLPGVGPTLARRLAAARRSRGRWRRLADLTAVRGISARQLARWSGLVTVEAPPGPPVAHQRAAP